MPLRLPAQEDRAGHLLAGLSDVPGIHVRPVPRTPRRMLPPVPQFRLTRTGRTAENEVTVTLRSGALPRMWHVGVSGGPGSLPVCRQVPADLAPAFPCDVVLRGLRAWAQAPGTPGDGLCALGRAWDLAAGTGLPVLTYAQELWAVEDRPPHLGDGRFVLDGDVEPCPGCWPAQKVVDLFDRDRTAHDRFPVPGGDT